MYSKVALVSLLSLIVSGCSITGNPKPNDGKPDVNATQVEVVEEIVEDAKPVVATITEDKVIVKSNKYNLKPEPYSLESNEDDPELLGPQTTLDKSLDSDNEDDSSANKPPKERTTKKAKSNTKTSA